MTGFVLALWTTLAVAEPQAVAEPRAAAAGSETLTERQQRRLERKERRRQRRESRRRARAEGRELSDSEPDPDAEEAAERSLEEGMAVSSEKANKLGDMLKKTLTSASAAELPAGGGRSLGAALASAVPPGPPALKTPPSPARPRTIDDFLAAARSGYAASFEAVGLKVGHKAIVDESGAPATAQQLEALAAHIASEPEALMRRPDFFKVLPREKFQDLKKDIKRPDMGEEIFKHVMLTEGDRDFVWSQSCGGVGGGCNRYVSQPSYRRGEGLPPEDLGSLWTAVHDGAPQLQPAASAAVDPKGIRSRLNVVLSHIRSVFQGDNPAASKSAPGVFAGGLSWGGGQRPEVSYSSAPEKKRLDVASPVAVASSVLPLSRDQRPAAAVAFLLAAAGLAAATLRSRR